MCVSFGIECTNNLHGMLVLLSESSHGTIVPRNKEELGGVRTN